MKIKDGYVKRIYERGKGLLRPEELKLRELIRDDLVEKYKEYEFLPDNKISELAMKNQITKQAVCNIIIATDWERCVELAAYMRKKVYVENNNNVDFRDLESPSN